MEKQTTERSQIQDKEQETSNEKTGREQEKKYDISNIDRQEGEMNNGELGGNFKEEAQHKNSSND